MAPQKRKKECLSVKRFLAILLLLTLLPLIPALGEDDIDVPAVIVEDTWIDDNLAMTFAADGTGTLTYKNITHEGTWEIVNNLVYFRYEQLGEQIVKLTMSKWDGEYRLSANSFLLQMKSARERIEQDARKAAKKKLHALEWGEEIALDFMSFTLDDVKVCRSVQQIVEDFPSNYTLSTVKGKKYLLVYGTVKNPDDIARWLGNIRAEAVLDGESTYKMEVYCFEKGATYFFNSTLNGNAKGQICFAAEIPEEAAESFKTAQVNFSLYNYLAGTPQKDYEGDFFFTLKIGKAKVKTAKKGASLKKEYYEYGKNKSVPKPSSYTEVSESLNGAWGSMHPTDGKVYDAKNYFISSRFEGDNAAELSKIYVKGLKGEGLTVTKVSGAKSKYNNETVTYYTINDGKTALGWIEVSDSNTYGFNVIIMKK